MAHNREHHQAMDSLVNLFTKANHDLTVVQHRLEKEFQQVYPDNVSTIQSLIRGIRLRYLSYFDSLNRTFKCCGLFFLSLLVCYKLLTKCFVQDERTESRCLSFPFDILEVIVYFL